MANTTRWLLPYPLSTDPPNGPAELQALALALDGVAMDDQGILSSRPVSTSPSPGKRGRYYMVVGDSTPANNGILWRDNGTGWDPVGALFDATVTTAKIADGAVTPAKLELGADPTAFGTAFPTTGLFNGYRYSLLISGVLFDFMYRHDLDGTYGWYCTGGPGIEQDGTDVTFTTPIAGHWRGHYAGSASVSSLGDAAIHNTYAGTFGWGANFVGGGSAFVSGAVAASTAIRSWISGTNSLSGHIGHIIWPYKLAG